MAAKDLSRHQQGIVKRYYDNQDTIQSHRLSEMVSELWLAEDPKKQTQLWGKAQIALMRMGVSANRVAQVVGKRDLEALAKLVQQADAGAAQGQTPDPHAKVHRNARSAADGRTLADLRSQKHAATGNDALDKDNLKKALRAFRKKLKVIRLDDESRLGNRYTTAGRTSAIAAITPPPEYPVAVWEKLVELGRLRKAGQGTYQLPDQ